MMILSSLSPYHELQRRESHPPCNTKKEPSLGSVSEGKSTNWEPNWGVDVQNKQFANTSTNEEQVAYHRRL